MKKLITIWCKDDEFNHIEDGFDELHTTPKSVSIAQEKSWTNGKWVARCGYIIDGTVYEAEVTNELC